jgi:hypothetical protein
VIFPMTQRTLFERPRAASPDFTSLTNAAAIARIRQLAAQGITEVTLAELFAWNRTDVRRAIAPATAELRQ